MSFEVTLNSVDFDEFDERYRSLHPNTVVAEDCFHEAIFSASGRAYQAIQAVSLREKPSVIDHKTQRIARNHGIAPMGTVSGEVGLSVDWGGKNGTEISGYASGSASDDNGNKVEVTVEVKGDGSGNASASASHDEETGS